LLSILSHEYAHILTGRYFGVQSTKVIMFALGGAALLESKIKKPLHEFLIALAGPFWSFYLSVVFMMSFFMFGDIEALEQQLDFRSMDQLSAVFIITSLINFTLAVFNMVPAYPLDGGRVLHSALWKLFGLQKSNFASIMSGKVLGYGMPYVFWILFSIFWKWNWKRNVVGHSRFLFVLNDEYQRLRIWRLIIRFHSRMERCFDMHLLHRGLQRVTLN
jgi:Zn-dependent protease